MTKSKIIIFLAIVFIFSVVLSFYFEDKYEKIVRSLYETLSYHKISFRSPAKYFHFASDLFVFSFGLYTTILGFFVIRQKTRQRFLNIIFTLFFLVISTILYCYFNSSIKLIECTACDTGTLTLNFNDINYDKIFVISLMISAIPTLTIEIRRFIKKQRKTKLKADP